MHLPAFVHPAAVRGGRSIRVGMVLLAVFGFMLLYDALRQMAVAAHIRGVLTYLFPLVIDGFIAIGVIALLILRTAPTCSRLYVWALVGLATLASIWANALHAIRLNEQTRLHLNNATVGALSAIAPLALAGAVHLYLVINRHLATNREAQATEAPSATPPARPVPPKPNRQVRQEPTDGANTVPSAKADAPKPDAKAAIAVAPQPTAKPKKGGRKTVPDEVLWATARAVGSELGTVPRTTLEDVVRDRGYTIQKDRAKEVANAVTAELASANNAATAA
ncbi:DUF2637 domain-containing protein [Streptomyces sp. NPDC048595]|uniref:DUF2637 domain-containing protein n=1 Tax=Streptomyces sp. NPDC048595 TaxID=3365576 RepID=UPI003711FF00